MDELLDSLGGNTKVADALGCTPNAVSNWRTRGIPWKQRPAIARLAENSGITLPRDFWGERAA